MNGKPNGKGILFNEQEYEGEWKDDNPNGKGVFYYENGNKQYEGELKDNNANGSGVLYYDNGNVKYEGEWKDCKPNGNGILYYKNNGKKQFDGEWMNGKPNGKGMLFNEQEYKGEWQDGLLEIGNGVVIRYIDSMMGVMNEKRELIYIGGMKEGKANGFGSIMNEEGELIEGEWYDGILNLNNGTRIEIMNGHVYLIENEERREMNVMTLMTPYIHGNGEIVMTYEFLRLLNDEEKKKEIEYLVIGEGCGNELQMDLNICDYPNLKELSIHNNSLNNIHSLTISNNLRLGSIVIGEENNENDLVPTLENVKQLSIMSIESMNNILI